MAHIMLQKDWATFMPQPGFDSNGVLSRQKGQKLAGFGFRVSGSRV